MATETLAEKKSEAEAPAKEGDGVGDSVKETVSEKADSLSPESDSAEEKDEAKEEMEEKEEEKADKKQSGRKKSAEKEPVTPVSDRPTRERKKVERYSLPTPSRSSGSKSVSIEKNLLVTSMSTISVDLITEHNTEEAIEQMRKLSRTLLGLQMELNPWKVTRTR